MTAAVLVMAVTVPACSSSASQGASKAAGGDSKSFTYWSMWKEDEPQASVIKEALASYQAATGVTVAVEWRGRGVLDDIAAAIKAGKPVPDLSDGSVNTVLGAGAEGVDVTDLTDLYQQPVPGENQNLTDVVPDKYTPLMTATNGAVAAADACSIPGWRATPRATASACSYEDTGPCQSSGTLRIAEPVIVLSECPTNSSIAPRSATAAASTTMRTSVRPGARMTPASANRTGAITRTARCR